MFWLLLLSLAAASGTMLRFAVSLTTTKLAFPLSTLIVNAIGGFLVGYIHAQEKVPSAWKFYIVVGFLGAMTTFSSYSLETIKLIERGEWYLAASNVVLNNSLGIGLCFVGIRAARWL